MLRGGNREIYERQIEGIRKLMPDAGLRTSFIVGFPGETDDDFREILTFMRNVEFDNVGVFLYSDEEGTGAFDLDGKVHRRTARRRSDQLMKEQAENLNSQVAQDGGHDEWKFCSKGLPTNRIFCCRDAWKPKRRISMDMS